MRQLAEYVRELPYLVEAFRATIDTGIRVCLIEVAGQYRSIEAVPFLAVFCACALTHDA